MFCDTGARKTAPGATRAGGVFCPASVGGSSVLRRTKRTLYTCSVILKSVRYITLMFKLDNGILGTRKG